MPRLWSFGLLMLLLTACGDDSPVPSTTADAGPQDAPAASPDGAPRLVVPEPAPPVLTPCPEGWVENRDKDGFATCDPWPGTSPVAWACPEGWHARTENGATTCHPYPESGPETCDNRFQAHFPGEPGCRRIGTACPERGEFAPDLPTTRVVYVRAGATGGTGSRDRPYGSLDEVPFPRLFARTTVALTAGVYEGQWLFNSQVTLWGACPEQTVLRSPARTYETIGILTLIEGSRVTVRNLSLQSSLRLGAAAVGNGAALNMEGVLIDGMMGAGVASSGGAEVELTDTVVRATRAGPDGAFGAGLLVQDASATVLRGVFERNTDAGLYASGPASQLSATDVVARDTRAQGSDGTRGLGVDAQRGASVTVVRGLFERNLQAGLFAGDTDTTLTVSDVVVRETLGQTSDSRFGRGLNVQGGASAVVARALFDGNRDRGVFVGGAAATLTAADIVVRGTLSRAPDGGFGRGLHIGAGATAAVERALIEKNRDVGVWVSGSEARLSAADVIVRDTLSLDRERSFGRGLSVTGGGSATVIRSLFEGNRDHGVWVSTPSSQLAVTDIVVRDTRSLETDGRFGRGLAAQDGASATVQRGLFERNRDVALFAALNGSTLSLEDIVVRDTLGRENDSTQGGGLGIQEGASGTARRVLFERNRGAGVIADGPGTTLAITDAVVRDTLSQQNDGARGSGLAVQLGASATVERALFERNRDHALLALGAESVLSVREVLIKDTLSQERDGNGGRGLTVEEGASATVVRTRIEGSRDFGVVAAYDASVDLDQVVVTQIARATCASTPSGCLDSASGVGAFFDARVRLLESEVRGAEICGLIQAGNGDLSAQRSVIEGNLIGACIQDQSFDTGKVGPQEDNVYRNNGTRLERTSYPSPDPITPIQRF